MNHSAAIEPQNQALSLDPFISKQYLLGVIEDGKREREREWPRNRGKPKPPFRQCRDIAELCLADDLPELQHWMGLGVLGDLPDRCQPLSANVWGSFEASYKTASSSVVFTWRY